MEIVQNGAIFEDEENEQSYRDGAFDERLFINHCYRFTSSLIKVAGNVDKTWDLCNFLSTRKSNALNLE